MPKTYPAMPAIAPTTGISQRFSILHHLTDWTEMCSALADNNTLDKRAANGAGLARAVVNSEIILETATAIDPIEAGSIMFDTGQQDSLNCMIKFFCFRH